MRVEELLELLASMPPTATVLIREVHEDDKADPIAVTYDRGLVLIDAAR